MSTLRCSPDRFSRGSYALFVSSGVKALQSAQGNSATLRVSVEVHLGQSEDDAVSVAALPAGSAEDEVCGEDLLNASDQESLWKSPIANPEENLVEFEIEALPVLSKLCVRQKAQNLTGSEFSIFDLGLLPPPAVGTASSTNDTTCSLASSVPCSLNLRLRVTSLCPTEHQSVVREEL